MKRHFYFSMKNCTSPDDLKKRLLTVLDHYQVCIYGLLTKHEVKMAGYRPFQLVHFVFPIQVM